MIASVQGAPSILDDCQRQALREVVENGPIPAVHGAVRWRLIELAQWVFDEFPVSISKQTLSRELPNLGFRKLSALQPDRLIVSTSMEEIAGAGSESLNGKLCSECLNANWFLNLDEARRKCEAWRIDYNNVCSHNITPIELHPASGA